MSYQKAYEESIKHPDQFWGQAAREIRWYKPFEKVFDDFQKPFYRWFPGGETNTCYNAVDYHVESGRGGQADPVAERREIQGVLPGYVPGVLLHGGRRVLR